MGTYGVVYRLFNVDNEILYIGATVNLRQRLSAHQVEKEWWHEVAHWTWEAYPDRKALLEAEKVAIGAERPRYNVVYNRTPVQIVKPSAVGSTHSLDEVAAQFFPHMKNGKQWLTKKLNRGELRGYKISRWWRMTDRDIAFMLKRLSNDEAVFKSDAESFTRDEEPTAHLRSIS